MNFNRGFGNSSTGNSQGGNSSGGGNNTKRTAMERLVQADQARNRSGSVSSDRRPLIAPINSARPTAS